MGLELSNVGVAVPAEDLHQLSQMLGHEWKQEGVGLLLALVVGHEEVDELAELDLVLIAGANAQQLLLDHAHPAHPTEDVQVQLHDGQPSLHVPIQQAVDEVLKLGREGVQVALTGPPPLILLDELVLVLAAPREVVRDQVVQQNAEGKGIAFHGVGVANQRFRRHVKRTADQILLLQCFFKIGQRMGEPKIAQFINLPLKEHIRRLDVPVHDLHLGQITTGQTDLLGSNRPIERLLAVDARLEGAALTVLHDDVAVVGGVVDVQQRDDVRVVQHFQNPHLVFQEQPAVRTHAIQSYHLEGNGLRLVVIADAAIDHTAETAADDIVEVEAEGADALLGGLGRGGLGLLLAVALVEGGVGLPAGRLSWLLLQWDKFSFHSIITDYHQQQK